MSILYKADTSVIFYKMSTDFTTLRGQLASGEKTGKDHNDVALSSFDSVSALMTMSNHRIGSTKCDSILANIALYPFIVGIIHEDMLNASLASQGLTIAGELSKISTAVTAIQVGMFNAAAVMLPLIATDAFLTTARLALYASLLNSSDALAQNGF